MFPKVISFTIHHVYSYRKVPMFLLNLLKRTLWLFFSADKTNIKSKPSTVAEHFLSHPNHCYTDMQLIQLERIHSSRD